MFKLCSLELRYLYFSNNNFLYFFFESDKKYDLNDKEI